MLITQAQQQAIELRIGQIEKTTDAEIVCVITSQSDDYYYIPALWAAILALVSPLPLWFSPWWHQTTAVVMVQFFVFLAAWVVFRRPKVLMRLIPVDVRQWRASNLAKRCFLENKLHHTIDRKGVLLFISEAERYVEIFADHGIAALVDNQQWQSIISALIDDIHQGHTYEGILTALQGCGDLLSTKAPAATPRNELPDRLIVLDV